MTTITIDRAVVEQALHVAESAGYPVALIKALRAALAQQAEPVQEPAFHGFMSDDGTQVDVCFSPSAPRRDGTYATAYYTAPPHRVAQQAEPVEEPYTSERHFALREAYCIGAADAFWKERPGTKDDGRTIAFDAGFARGFDKGTCLAEQRLATLARQDEPVEPVAWKQGNLVTFNEDPYPALGGLFVQFWDGEEVAARVYANDLETIRQRCAKVNTAPPQQVAQQAEPLNLSDPAVQKRLAAQWGYVPAAQAEPVGPVAQFDLNTMPGQADAHLRALLRYTENFYATAIEHGMRAGPTANAIAHVERAGKALHQIVHAQAKMLEPARPVEPVAPVEPVEPVATLIAQRDALLEALKKADHFITNGIELGFIRMPDADTPDTAHETPGIVRAAIKSVEGEKT